MIDAMSIAISKAAFLKVNIVLPFMNPEPAQGVTQKLNVQGHGRHRMDLQPNQWILAMVSTLPAGSDTTLGLFSRPLRG